MANRSVDSQQRILLETVQGLNPRGRSRTEAALRHAYGNGDESVQVAAARFLVYWTSSRRFELADEWLAQSPSERVFDWITACYETAPAGLADNRFLRLFERSGLTDVMTHCLIDRFGSYMEHRRGALRRTAIDLIAVFGDHPCPEIRWTVSFRLATLRANDYRDLLERLAQDNEKSSFGIVSRVSKNALAFLDGNREVNLHDASEP